MFFPALPGLYLGTEALFAIFSSGRGNYSTVPTDRVRIRTSLICLQILSLSEKQGRGTSRGRLTVRMTVRMTVQMAVRMAVNDPSHIV